MRRHPRYDGPMPSAHDLLVSRLTSALNRNVDPANRQMNAIIAQHQAIRILSSTPSLDGIYTALDDLTGPRLPRFKKYAARIRRTARLYNDRPELQAQVINSMMHKQPFVHV